MPRTHTISNSSKIALLWVAVVYVLSLCYLPTQLYPPTIESQVLEVKQATDSLIQPAFFKADIGSGISLLHANFLSDQVFVALLAFLLFVVFFTPAYPLTRSGFKHQQFQFSIFSKGP